MSRITATFARNIARIWHRLDADGHDMEGLASMLAPMDDAGEKLSARVGFDMEPADYDATLEALAKEGDDA